MGRRILPEASDVGGRLVVVGPPPHGPVPLPPLKTGALARLRVLPLGSHPQVWVHAHQVPLLLDLRTTSRVLYAPLRDDYRMGTR